MHLLSAQYGGRFGRFLLPEAKGRKRRELIRGPQEADRLLEYLLYGIQVGIGEAGNDGLGRLSRWRRVEFRCRESLVRGHCTRGLGESVERLLEGLPSGRVGANRDRLVDGFRGLDEGRGCFPHIANAGASIVARAPGLLLGDLLEHRDAVAQGEPGAGRVLLAGLRQYWLGQTPLLLPITLFTIGHVRFLLFSSWLAVSPPSRPIPRRLAASGLVLVRARAHGRASGTP